MFCYSCQARNNESNLFCTSCGTRLAPPSPEQVCEGQDRSEEGLSPRLPYESNFYGMNSHKGGSFSSDVERLNQGRGGVSGAGTSPLQHNSSQAYPVGWRPLAPDSTWTSGQGTPWTQINGLTPYSPPMPEPYNRSYLSVSSITCAECGYPRSSRLEACPYCGRRIVNNSGQGVDAPLELASGWNWGAFMFPVLWSISHENWFGLLALLPGIHIVVAFVLGARGNALAWQNRRFVSAEQFQAVQQAWRNCAIGYGAIMAAFLVLLLFAMAG